MKNNKKDAHRNAIFRPPDALFALKQLFLHTDFKCAVLRIMAEYPRPTTAQLEQTLADIVRNPDKVGRARAGRRSLRELAQIIGDEWVDYTTEDGKILTMSRNMLVLWRFYESAMKKPTAQKLLALQKILGEDVFRIGTAEDSDHKGDITQLTGELNGLIKAINYRAHTVSSPADGADHGTALDFVNYDVIEEPSRKMDEAALARMAAAAEARKQARAAKNENKPQISPKNE